MIRLHLYSTDTCQPCKALKVVLDKLLPAYQNLELIKIQLESPVAENKISKRFGIRGVPVLIAFKEGQEISRLAGMRPVASIRAFLDKLE